MIKSLLLRHAWPCVWIVLLISISSVVDAQSLVPDSLRRAFQTMPDDSNKVKQLYLATVYFPYIQTDSALHYADSIIHFSEKIDFQYGKTLGLGLKAEAYLYKGDYSRGLYFAQQALQLSEALGDQPGIVTAHGQLCSFFSEIGDYKQAIAEISKSREIFYSLGDSIYNPMTNEHVSNGIGKLNIEYNLAKTYLAANLLDTALMFAKRALQRDQDLKRNWSAPPVLLGDIYYKKNDYESALLSYDIKTTFNFAVDSAKNFLGKASVFAKKHQRDSCRLYAQKALVVSQRIKFLQGAMQASEMLSLIYENVDLNEAIKYYKISTAIKDSLYSKEKINQFNGIMFNDELRKLDAKAAEESARNKFRIWSLLGVMFTFLVTGILLLRNNQHKKKANILLQQEKQTVEKTLERLRSTQSLLVQSEKMASLGELTAGIAHEIQNPLNFVNNFSEVSSELLEEMKEEIQKGNFEEVRAITDNVKQNLEKILQHGKRADGIVKGMLQHSRSSSGIKEPTDINALADEYLRLAYHGFRAKDKSFNASTNVDLDRSIGKINVVPQDIGRVVLNLITNAFYAVTEKQNQTVAEYQPTVSLSTKRLDDCVLICVKDNGNGIPEQIREKIFQPFFTTKPTGQGTGLGLSLSYDIVKAHGGELTAQTKEGGGSEFVIQIPLS